MVRGVLALKNLRGLVLETFGAGNAPEDGELIGVLKEGAQNGVVIVNVTQCQVGSVSPLYASATSLARAGVVFGLDMTSEGICFNLNLCLPLTYLALSHCPYLLSFLLFPLRLWKPCFLEMLNWTSSGLGAVVQLLGREYRSAIGQTLTSWWWFQRP